MTLAICKTFVEIIFPKLFDIVAQGGHLEFRNTYSSMFDDRAKYNAVVRALAQSFAVRCEKIKREKWFINRTEMSC